MVKYRLLEMHPATRRYRPGVLLIRAAQAAYPGTSLRRAMPRPAGGALGIHRFYRLPFHARRHRHRGAAAPERQQSRPGAVPASGTRRSAFTTAMGRVLLSRLSGEAFSERYGKSAGKKLPDAPAGCPATVGNCVKRVAAARAERSAIAINEGMPGIGAVATTIADPASGDLQGLCLSFTAMQVGQAQAQALRDALVEAVAALGQRIGDPLWRDPPAPTDEITQKSPELPWNYCY
ncbi:IclR family transcriptional regulator [Cupriavidus basilensis]